MSQVVQAIAAADTGERKQITKGLSPLFTDVFQTKSEWTETYSPEKGVAKIYRIGVKIGAQAMVTEYDMITNNGNDRLAAAVNRTKRQVIEAIFGEFRQDFRSIEKAIYNHQYETAGKLLHDMEYKMFEVSETK